MSTPSGLMSSSSFQSKELISEPKIKSSILIASIIPGHMRLPAPNGTSSKFLPLISMFDPKNLSGENKVGLSHKVGSLPMVHTLINTWASFGMVRPHKSTSFSAFRGSKKGTGGCKRRVFE
ncbi:hypothetical protein CR513_32032, partial [Mucuna pruriens]